MQSSWLLFLISFIFIDSILKFSSMYILNNNIINFGKITSSTGEFLKIDGVLLYLADQTLLFCFFNIL
jgi:hypothetical protein